MAKKIVKGHELRVAELEGMIWQVINQSGFKETSTIKFVIGNIYNDICNINSGKVSEQRQSYMIARSKEKGEENNAKA
jgi:hypothetical protein